jgi:hypothetical protein
MLCAQREKRKETVFNELAPIASHWLFHFILSASFFLATFLAQLEKMLLSKTFLATIGLLAPYTAAASYSTDARPVPNAHDGPNAASIWVSQLLILANDS